MTFPLRRLTASKNAAVKADLELQNSHVCEKVMTSDVIPIPVLAGTNESSRIRDDNNQKLDFYLKLIGR